MPTDAELLLSSDPDAFAAFYDRHVATVAAYLGRGGRSPELQFDLLGETFARAYEHRRRYEPRKGPAIAWLLNTARYVVADAERRGQVPDTARTRLGLQPFVLDGAGLAAIAERGRTDLGEALAGLPESQRIAVYRRVLDDDEYAPAPPAISVSGLVLQDPEARKTRDPFELLGERLFLAAGGHLQTSRRTWLAIATVLVMLFGAGLAVAALRLSGEDPQTPAPTPTETPMAAPPDPTATPAPQRPRGRPRPSRPQTPTKIDLQLIPDLRAGRIGWCVDMSIQAGGRSGGHRGCTPVGRAGTMVIAAGGVAGGGGYAIVDEAVAEIRLSDGRRISPDADPDLPAQWRSASWPVNGELPRFTVHDASGVELPPITSAPLDPLRTRAVSAANPPRRHCAIRTTGNLRATSARLVTEPIDAHNAVDPSYVACASSVYRIGDSRLRATVLVSARAPTAVPPDLPSTGGAMTVRRAGGALLAVYGGTAQQRERVLDALKVQGP